MQIFFSIFTFFVIYTTLYSYGSVLTQKFFNNSNIDIFFKILAGYVTVGFITLISHFFFEINNIFSMIIIIIGLVIFIFKHLFVSQKKYILPLLIIISSCFFLFAYSDHPIDANMYHHPYVSYLKSEKIIFGIANIQFRFGHISFLQYVQAAFTNDYLHIISLATINIIFYITFFIFVSGKIFEAKTINFNLLITILFSCFLLIKFARYREFGNDLIPLLVSIYFFLNIINIQSKYSLSKDNLIHLFLPFVAFMFMHKISYIFTFLIFSTVFLKLKKRSMDKKKIFSLVIFVTLILPWLIKNYITTSCLVYPVISSCFSNSLFQLNGLAAPESASWLTEIWAKGFIAHPDWQNINLKNYASGFNWVPTWITSHFLKILEIIAPLILIIFIFSIYIYFNKDNFLKKKKIFHLNKPYAYLWISIFFGLIVWFYKAPVFRFGSFYIISIIILSYILLLNFFFDLKKFSKVRFYKIIFSICLIFFFSKNILRVYVSNNSLFPKTSFYENLEKFKISNNYEIMFLKPKQSGLCYYTKLICSHEIPKNIDLKKFKNYYIITN